MSGSGHPLDEINSLQLAMIEAEYYQQCGEHSKAANALEPQWRQLKPRLEAWSNQEPLEPTDKNRALLRQQLWALLHYVSYRFYREKGSHDLALDYFTKIDKVIRVRLQSKSYVPYGTLGAC
jgi:hypothetical protein